MRNLTKTKAREMAAARKVFRGGRPRKPTACPKCQALCQSARKALAHC